MGFGPSGQQPLSKASIKWITVSFTTSQHIIYYLLSSRSLLLSVCVRVCVLA